MNNIETIQKIIENYSDYITFISLLLAIIAIIIAYRFHKKSKKVIQLKHKWNSYELIVDSISKYPKLQMTYNETKLENLTVSLLNVKNKGTEIIRDSDISGSNPLKVYISEEFKILDYSVFNKVDASNEINCSLSDNELKFEFNYLNTNDYFNIQILHTGKAESLKIKGSIIGEKEPLVSHKDEKEIKMHFLLRFMITTFRNLKSISFIISLALCSFLFYKAFAFDRNIVTWIILVLLGLYFLYSAIKILFKKNPLSDLSDDESQFEHFVKSERTNQQEIMRKIFKK